nr:unnamed protein product [Spirometra erinaceieuropaei]
MPLLNGEPFVKKSPAPHMNPDDEVFFSPITFEIFQDYDEFFERTILLNSATWNCSFCNKSQLTYTEAVACEKSDLDQLNNFGVALCRGLLYITFQARRRKLSELVDLLHGFVHYRFFVGESVFVKRSDFKTAANQCVVIERVLPPPGRDCKKIPEPSPANAPECMNTPPELPDPSVIKYVVKRSATTGPAHCSVPENSSSMILYGSVLQRGPKNFLTRDKIKFFIRQTCELEFSVFKPKKSIMEHFNLEPFGSLSWTDFFVAPEPLWYDLAPPPVSLIKPKMLRIDTAPPKAQPSHQSAQMGNTGGISDCSGAGGGGAPLKKLAYSPRVPSSQQQPKIVVNVGRAQSFEENQAQAARAARLAALDADRLLRMERADLERDWALLRKREDLELSDLIPLPDFTEVSTRLPVEEFGRAIQILEFLNIYAGLPQTDSAAGGPAICGKSSAVRAAATAAAVGAASLPPLDRAGLSEALWLHIATAPAKAGGWRGAIWGGTRPLDDPCISLMRDYPELVQKLRSVPVFAWPPNEKLLILTVLMDELLLQPQLRDRMEENLEKLRGLRLQLRSIQAERFKLYGGSASIAATLYGFSPSALVSSGDNWLTGTPPILRAQLARGRRKPVVAPPGAAKPAPKPVSLATAADTKGSASNPPTDPKPDPSCPNGEEAPPVDAGSSNELIKNPLSTFGEELDLEENELWQTMLSVACSCSMIPLGQDRIYRRYWLVLSLPALLIESTAGEMTEIPGFPAAASNVCLRPPLRVRGRQVAKSLTLGSSPAEAAEALNAAVKALLTTPMEDLQWQNPGLLDRDSLISQLAIDLPTNREQLSLEQLRILVHPERRGSAAVDADHPAVLQVEKLQATCSRWAVLLPVPSTKSQPPTPMKPEEGVESSTTTAELSYADRYERATAAVTQLEASLNPRGHREGRLRKSISQLRPLLIQAVADCPAELLTRATSQSCTQPSVDVGRTPAAAAADRSNWEDILFSWLECTIHGVGMRLGLDSDLIQGLLKPLPPSRPDTEDKNDHKDAMEYSSSPLQSDGQTADASQSLDCVEVPKVSTTDIKNFVPNKHQSGAAQVATTPHLLPKLLHSLLTDSDNQLPARVKLQTDRVDQHEENAVPTPAPAANTVIIPPAPTPVTGDRPKVSQSPPIPAGDAQSQQPKEPTAADLNPNSPASQSFSDRLRRLADIVINLGLAVGPRRLAGPLSNDERSIRGLQASKSAPSLLAVTSTAEDSPSNQHPHHCESPAPASGDVEDSGLVPSLPLQTTGWQRWLSSVASTTSISQLHLLTRALERAARRAARGGRGVPAAIFSYASQIPLPEIRCTACGGPPDSNPTPTRGPGCSLIGAFSVCSACACPFHLDCLLCSRARTPSSRNFRPRAASRVSARASELSALPLARHLASPYTLLGALLGSASATRAELTGLSLLLCDRCRRLAGYPVSETFVEASATCVPPPPAPSVVVADVDTTASTDTTAATAGGGDASIASDSPLGTSDISMTVSPRRTSRSTLHENGPLSATLSPPRGRQKRGRPPSSSSLTNRTVGRGRGRGRPPKRPRFHLEEANHAEHDDHRREEAAEEEEDLEAGLGGRSGADAVRRDPADCVHYDDEEDAFLQHRAESSDPVASSPRLNGEFTRGAKLAAARRRSGAPTSAGVEEQSDGTCAAEFGLNHQAAAERFLAEISSLSVARPLIRCALGRTVLSEERNSSSSSLWQFPPPQPTTAGDNSSYRTRRTTQGCGAAADGCSPSASSLYAYDLDGLTDLLSRRALPRGPGEVVSQLRLLIRHFINSNRPGSRLHHCAQDLAAYVERRLSELGQQNSSAVEDADGGSFRAQPTLP